MAYTSDTIFLGISPPLITENIRNIGFSYIFDHIWSRVKSTSADTITNSYYIELSLDTMTNIYVNNLDSHIFIWLGV